MSVDVTLCIGVVLDIVAVGVLALGAAKHVGLGALELGLREAVTAHALHFGVDSTETVEQLAVLGLSHERRGFERRVDEYLTLAHVCRQERSVGLHAHLLQTGVLHALSHGNDCIDRAALQGVVDLAGQGVALGEHSDRRILHLGIREDRDYRLLVARNHDDLLGRSIGIGSRNVRHHGLDLGLYGIHVDVADDIDRLVVGTVPRVVELFERLVVEALQAVEITDQVALGILRVLIQGFEHGYGRTPLGSVAGAQLLHDDAALRIDLRRLQGDEVRPVVQDRKGGVDSALASHRNVLYHILGIVPARAGIEVVAEHYADLFQIVYHGLARKVLRTVEGHMFEEVSQTLLVVVLLYGTHVMQDVEAGLTLGLLVVADVVGHAVFELAYTKILIGRDRLQPLSRNARRSDKKSGE